MNVGTRDVVTCITCYARDSRDKELSETFQQGPVEKIHHTLSPKNLCSYLKNNNLTIVSLKGILNVGFTILSQLIKIRLIRFSAFLTTTTALIGLNTV
jgi:hypothetical protein